MSITEKSRALFFEFVKDAANWGGTPLVQITNQERGNLTQLKIAGLITTFDHDGDMFVEFTQAGEDFARTGTFE